jgi:hypothetical protein
MTQLVVDAETWTKLSNPRELLEICDQAGRTLGYYQPAVRVGSIDENGKICSPFTEEEIEQRRRPMGDRPLKDFWKDLGQP